jgi:hypothetical protein
MAYDSCMETYPEADLSGSSRFDPSGGDWWRIGLWFLAAMLIGLAAAWFVQIAQAYYAPLLIFPLLIGVATGALLVATMRILQLAYRPVIALGAVLAIVVTMTAAHYFSYLAAYRTLPLASFNEVGLAAQHDAVVNALKPSFLEFLNRQAKRGRPLAFGITARDGFVWLSWGFDTLLALAAAAAMLAPALRQPYCRRCRSWYRTVRAGRLDVATARRLAAAASLAEIEEPQRARFRLACCDGGCGPTCLELSWEALDGRLTTALAWMEPAVRNHISQILDEAAESG